MTDETNKMMTYKGFINSESGKKIQTQHKNDDEVVEIMKDKGFIKYMHDEYKKKKRIDELKQKRIDMMTDMKSMTAKQFNEKYEGNASRAWAILQGEIIKAKNE